MSRCFPFPPTAYANKGLSNREALVELNKPQKEKEEAKIQRGKETKNLRKDDEHTDRKKHKFVIHGKLNKPKDEKKHHQQGKSAGLKAKYPSKKVDDESEKLEKSDLTEEHDQPTVSSVYYLSDGTQSSNKRKRHDDEVNGSEPKKRITFRIKLPLRNQRERDSSVREQDKNCHSTVPEIHTPETLGKAPTGEPLCHASNVPTKVEPERLNLKPCLELPLSTQETETRTEKKTRSPLKSVESVYKTLIENWVPEPVHQVWREDVDDQAWLFGSKKQQDKQESGRHKAHMEESCSRNSTSWPQAQYLREADIWALPYTVPF